MKRNIYLNFDVFNDLYYTYINTLVGKLIKKGKKEKALTFYKKLKENIKLKVKKKHTSFVFLLSLLNSIPKTSFKEIRLGSQKKDLPMPVDERKQVLLCVDTLLKYAKRKKTPDLDKLVEFIISSYLNKGIMIRNKRLRNRKALENKMLLNIFMPKKQN